MAKEMKKFVTIHSDINITVTPGLQNKDVTNPDAHVPDRLKVSPSWSSCLVDIKKGAGVYPSEIVNWPTVKALVANKTFTIGEYVDSDEPEDLKLKKKVEQKMKEFTPKAVSLDEIAGD